MSTTPVSWAKHTSVSSLLRAECAGYIPGSRYGPHYCCTANGKCVLMARPPTRCLWFERCLLPVAPAEVCEDYGRLCPGVRSVRDRVLTARREAKRVCPGVAGRACGEPLEARKRLCTRCRGRSRRASEFRARSGATVNGKPSP